MRLMLGFMLLFVIACDFKLRFRPTPRHAGRHAGTGFVSMALFVSFTLPLHGLP